LNLGDITLHRLKVYSVRSASTAKEIQPPLSTRGNLFEIILGLFQSETLNNETGLSKPFLDPIHQSIIGQKNHFYARTDKSGHNIALQKVHNREPVIGADKNSGFQWIPSYSER